MTGFLKSEHLVVSETRVGKSLKRVNPGYHHKRKESTSRVLLMVQITLVTKFTLINVKSWSCMV